MNKSLKTGIVGTVVAAICCFTPALVILLGVVGLSSFVGYLDFILLPTLGLFVLLIVIGIARSRKPTL
ncbi:MAG: mercury resistance system transport protein MerF [Candidatus Brocadiaceae bacterium]|nr:mercury resistance system transport protein MerF [Candidatus Brocadiaceae bacterium]